MSPQYQVLARKYRPNNFHELIGQTHVSQALINAINTNRLHHAYLFTGTRGVGKTTIARILAKCLNCDTGITSTPCGTCDSCVAIEQGRFIDLIEIDAASRTKVEDTRELLDNVPYAPTQGRYKVYLIDEVHMLSTHSFNALLKTLEEPPEHVKFLLATTDPQKLPITIISRCLQFVLRPLPQQLLTEHLSKLLMKEGIDFDDSALWQLAHAAKGSVRDSLSLTDQAIAFGQGNLTDNMVNEMLGLLDGIELTQLIADIYEGNKQAVAQHIEQMRQQLVDAGSVFDELADILHKTAMIQVMPSISLDVSEVQAEGINKLTAISADVLQLYYEIIIKSRENMALANTPMQALEMCLLRLLAFRPLSANEMPVDQVAITSADANVDSTVQTKDDTETVEKNVNFNNGTINNDILEADYKDDQLLEIQSDIVESSENILTSNQEVKAKPIVPEIEGPEITSTNTNSEQKDVTEQTNVLVEEDNTQVSQNFNKAVSEQTGQLSTNVIEDEIEVKDKVVTPNIEQIDGNQEVGAIDEALQIQQEPLENVDASVSVPISHALSPESNTTQEGTNSTFQNYDNTLSIEPNFEMTDNQTTYNENVIEEDESDFLLDMLDDKPQSTSIDPNTHADTEKTEQVLNTVVEDNEIIADIEPSPINADVNIDESSVDDPRDLLKCEKQDLTGEWTAQKWDYWLQTAREAMLLDEDELALARQGVMTGSCDGASVFKSNMQDSNFDVVFTGLTSKLKQQFANANYELVAMDTADTDLKKAVPVVRQQERQVLAENVAMQKISSSNAVSALSDSNAVIKSIKLM